MLDDVEGTESAVRVCRVSYIWMLDEDEKGAKTWEEQAKGEKD